MAVVYRVKASALQYTLFIAVVILLLLVTLLLFLHTQRLLELSKNSSLQSFETNTQLVVDSEISKSELWGAFMIKSSHDGDESQQNNQTGGSAYVRSALFTIPFLQDDAVNLYIPGNDNYVQLTGAANLAGAIKVPGGFLKTTSLGARIYEGTSLGDATVTTSTPQPLTRSAIKTLANWYDSENTTLQPLESMNKDVTNSFTKSTQVYGSTAPITLANQSIKGKVKVISTEAIYVQANAQLQDVLLVAPVVRIASGFKGRLHVIASDSLIVEQQARLYFPSSLSLVPNRIDTMGVIQLQEDTMIEGLVIQNQLAVTNNMAPSVSLDKGARVMGMIVNLSKTSLRGTVTGSLYSNGLITLEDFSIYQNVIVDGIIENPPWFSIFSESMQLKETLIPLLWLY